LETWAFSWQIELRAKTLFDAAAIKASKTRKESGILPGRRAGVLILFLFHTKGDILTRPDFRSSKLWAALLLAASIPLPEPVGAQYERIFYISGGGSGGSISGGGGGQPARSISAPS
jgi:hypothetical protein